MATSANEKGKQHVNTVEADVVEDEQNEGELVVISVMGSKLCEEWIRNSARTFYMCPNREWFTTYE